MVVYRFGSFGLDTRARELRAHGTVVHLEPQVFDVLAHLIANRDRLVPKEELLDTVWGSRFVTESALASRLRSVRAAVGDDGATQALIRTERGRGYRFVGTVREEVTPLWTAAGRLPSARTPLIGRRADIDALRELLSGHRLVTITGPGGAGKSTLGIEVARSMPDVAFVELAAVRGPGEIIRAVAEATSVEGAAADDPGLLVASLAARPLTLVLDNCEHLLDGVAVLADRLLDANPAAQLLATSREPLGIDGEAVHPLGSLGPDAATLFVTRAEAASRRPRLDPADPSVVELCDRLDGLPLAIELAAAQLRHLTLADLLARLDDRLGLLVGGRPRAGARHATLVGTLQWSHQLLAEPARDLFDRLGIFPASFDLPAATAVATARLGGTTTDPVAATNTLGDLVAKNLVVHDEGRYRLLETIRLYAAQRMDTAGSRPGLVEAVRQHVVTRVTAQSRVHAWLSAEGAARNRDDIANVRLAFEASVAGSAYVDAVDIMIGLSTLWRNAASYAEGLRWADMLRPLALAPRDRLWLHILEADLGLGSGDPRKMADAAHAAVALASDVDDPAAAVIAGMYRSLAAITRPDRAVAGFDAIYPHAYDAGGRALDRLVRAFRAVALLWADRPDEVSAEVQALTDSPGHGYDRYICIWAAFMKALLERDGPRLRRLMDIQIDNVHRSGLRENWLTMFDTALTMIAHGEDHLPTLDRARRRAEAEGRRADADIVFALAYAAACQDNWPLAAELLEASSDSLFRDTANFTQHRAVRDLLVRPKLSPEELATAKQRAKSRTIHEILTAHGLDPDPPSTPQS
ncbi:ATP-binding protein [Phytohabitans kaempferiae]|uniref:Winged helix-turn-helix domain-containing protein n=1 Tax=Phytohabitans kaempferiae TaxID=1620943 RepID=A0ABV6LWL0_9ACTN